MSSSQTFTATEKHSQRHSPQILPNGLKTIDESAAGTLPDEIYDGTLNWWRAGVRRILVKNLETETRWIGAFQAKVRTPMLDIYFLYSSALGSHTFFMASLPVVFFFGHFELGLGLIFVLAVGVYATSFLKDLVCSPRPYMPTVTRLSVGNHHLEYGFPSTHTTNSVSAALYIVLLLHSSPSISNNPNIIYPSYVLLAIYVFSIVVGRIYCGMHSFTDCISGMIVGSGITGFWFYFGQRITEAIANGGWRAPLAIIVAWILMINQHPQPIDDCPCFEDSIAFLSVLAGMALSTRHARWMGVDRASGFYQTPMPGSQGVTLNDWGLWILSAFVKMVVGVAAVFAFRLVAKPTLQTLLPPTFRFLAQMFTLPRRRWYTPATEYESVPKDYNLDGGLAGMRAIPSVIDLPSVLAGGDVDAIGRVKGVGLHRHAPEGLVRRRAGEKVVITINEAQEEGEFEGEQVRHYDADGE